MKNIILDTRLGLSWSETNVDVSLADIFAEDEDTLVYFTERAESVLGNTTNTEGMQFLFDDYTVEDYRRAELANFSNEIMPFLEKYFGDTFVANNYIDGEISIEITNMSYQDIETKECHHCGIMHAHSETVTLFDYPSDEKGYEVNLCSYYCLDSLQGMNYSRDFAYRTCDCCGRIICEQSPANGYLYQFKISEDGEMTCNECHRKEIYENGIDEEQLKRGKIQSNWHDWRECEEHGFTKYESYFVTDIEDFYNKIQHLFEDNLVLIENDRISILGDEGTVTVWTKPKD